MQTVLKKHIEPGCPYCDWEHNPDILCRNIADCRQQELPPPRPVKRLEVVRLIDAAGKLIGVKHVYREI
jgi:hypothetical protein